MEPVLLIVNADDYAYSDAVSRGVLDAFTGGIVTATGVLATGAGFEKHLGWLRHLEEIDIGVHLTLTSGRPLTPTMTQALDSWGGKFPGSKYRVALAVLSGRIRKEDVAEEWDAQVRRCVDAGVTVRFLNSHEHLHALPPLFRLCRQLAEKYRIPYLRQPRPEWSGLRGPGALARNAVLQALGWVNRDRTSKQSPMLLGVSDSGKLNMTYVEQTLRSLSPGRVYELMCHPGYLDPAEIEDPRLLAYHDWEGELTLLRSPAVSDLCEECGIRLVRFRDLIETKKSATACSMEVRA